MGDEAGPGGGGGERGGRDDHASLLPSEADAHAGYHRVSLGTCASCDLDVSEIEESIVTMASGRAAAAACSNVLANVGASPPACVAWSEVVRVDLPHGVFFESDISAHRRICSSWRRAMEWSMRASGTPERRMSVMRSLSAMESWAIVVLSATRIRLLHPESASLGPECSYFVSLGEGVLRIFVRSDRACSFPLADQVASLCGSRDEVFRRAMSWVTGRPLLSDLAPILGESHGGDDELMLDALRVGLGAAADDAGDAPPQSLARLGREHGPIAVRAARSLSAAWAGRGRGVLSRALIRTSFCPAYDPIAGRAFAQCPPNLRNVSLLVDRDEGRAMDVCAAALSCRARAPPSPWALVVCRHPSEVPHWRERCDRAGASGVAVVSGSALGPLAMRLSRDRDVRAAGDGGARWSDSYISYDDGGGWRMCVRGASRRCAIKDVSSVEQLREKLAAAGTLCLSFPNDESVAEMEERAEGRRAVLRLSRAAEKRAGAAFAASGGGLVFGRQWELLVVSPGGSDPARCMPLLRRVRSSCVSIVAAAVLDNPHLRAVLDACGEQSTGMHAARNASHFRNMASRYLPPAAASSDPCPMPPPAAAAPVGRVVEFPSVLPAGDDARAGTVSFSLRARLEQLVLGREDRIGYRDKCALASLVRIARRAAINASLRISDVVIALEDTKRLHSLEMGDISCSVCLEEGLDIEDPLVLNPGGCEHICCRACAARIAVGASIVGMKCPVCRSVVDRFAALSYSSTRRQGDREAEGGQRPKRARSGTASAQEAEEILRSLPPDVRATRRALDALRAEGVRGTIAVLFESPVLVSDIRASLRAGAEAFEEVDQPGAGHGATVLLVRACGGAALRVELCGAIVFALPSPACYSRVQHHLRRFEGPVITCVAGGSIVERVLADALASGGGGLRRSDLCRAYLSRS